MPTIRRLYNDQHNDYDRDMLETAWLTLADCTTGGAAKTRPAAVSRLMSEGWPLGVAIEYVVVAGNWDGKG